MNVGLIGTGVIGTGIGSRLIDSGHTLTVHDRRREAVVNILERGANWADTPRGLAETSEVVLTSLPGPQEVEAVVLDPATGVLAGLRPGNAYIDLTTNSPASFRRVAERFKQKGIEVLDAPISGRPPETTVMAGGEKANVRQISYVARMHRATGLLCRFHGNGYDRRGGQSVHNLRQFFSPRRKGS